MNSSISDIDSYISTCKKIVSDSNVFSRFKQIPEYTSILEHVTYEEGKEYAQWALLNSPIKENILKFQKNDIIGNPKKYNYEFGEYSPTTLRYAKILADLSQLKLENANIVEIGGGYGGQYVVLRQLFKPKKYTFIDLEPVLQLIKKYINLLQLDDIEIDYINVDSVPEVFSDLIISNYAFSECTTAMQDVYINKIINNSKNGYMLYNNMNGYNHEEFIKKVFKNVKIFPEQPQTHPKNVLLVW